MLSFAEAEEKFKDLQARIQRGEPMSEEQYQEEMQKLMVQDERGTFWSLEPGTGQWLYFNGTEWLSGIPPRVFPPVEPAPASLLVEPTPMTEEATSPAMDIEAVPTYEHTAGVSGERTAGIAPRPIRNATPFAVGDANMPWVPLAIGAVVLLLCAVVLFFGVRNISFGANVSPTATKVQSVPTPTEVVATDTPEPLPTIALTPTPSVASATLKERLRVRTGPSETAEIITRLDSGTTVTVVGRNADAKWLQIRLPNKTEFGWISNQSDYVTLSSDANALPVVPVTVSQASPTPTKKPSGAKPTPTETPAG